MKYNIAPTNKVPLSKKATNLKELGTKGDTNKEISPIANRRYIMAEYVDNQLIILAYIK